jgi:3-methylfumaryl-CoA hydratase
VEGYPDLVVQGPFAATKLLAFARSVSRRPIHSFEFRLLAPMFVSQPVTFAQGEASDTFVALRCDGTQSVTSKVTCGD